MVFTARAAMIQLNIDAGADSRTGAEIAAGAPLSRRRGVFPWERRLVATGPASGAGARAGAEIAAGAPLPRRRGVFLWERCPVAMGPASGAGA